MTRTPGIYRSISGQILALALLLASMAQAATPAELLEKAIYAEETVGNLDQAIELYQQVIAEAEAAETAAAQAQYRLGLVYQKLSRPQDATAAFQTLIERYPKENEWVSKAREHLPHPLKLLPAPWGDQGDVLQMTMKLPTGVEIGTYIYAVEPAEANGQPRWRCWSKTLVTLNDARGASTVLCDRQMFAPISSFWKHSMLGAAQATYEPDEVVIRQLADDTTREIELEGPVFDNEQAAQLFRRLPLSVGYKATLPLVATLGAGRIDLELEVTAKETVEVPTGKYECFRMELNIGQTFWIADNDERLLVRFQAGGVSAELSKILPATGGEPIVLDHDEFSLTLPADWFTYAPSSQAIEAEARKDQASKHTVFLLDPEMLGSAELGVSDTTDLPEDHQTSPGAWIKSPLDRAQKRLKDFRLVTDGVEEFRVGELPAARFVGTFSENGKQKTIYILTVVGDEHSALLHSVIASDEFESYRKELDKIVATLQLN